MLNNKPGRPPVLDIIKENIERIPKLKREGYTDEEICKIIGIGTSSMKRYKQTYQPLADALKKGKQQLIEDLEDTLYRRALGKCTTKTVKKYIEDVNGKEKTRLEETTQELPPDVGALCFALKNLAPDRWKETRLDNNFDAMQKALDNFKSFSERIQSEDINNVPEDDPLSSV